MHVARRPLRKLVCAAGVVLAFALNAAVAVAGEPPVTKHSPFVPPLSAVVAFATAEKIPLEQIDLAADAAEARPGDSVTALVTLYEGERYRQWLIQLTTRKLTSAERQAKPAPTLNMFTSIGTEVRFESEHLALELRTAGPFPGDLAAKPGKPFAPPDKRARKLVNAGFLRLGFDQSSRTILKLRQAAQDAHGAKEFGFGVSPEAFPAARIAAERPLAKAIGLTPDDERSLVGAIPALFEFFNVAQKTPGLQDILSALLDKASLAWSALTHGGNLNPRFNLDSAGISAIDATRWSPNLPPAYLFPFGVSINQKPTLACQLVVTAPRPPLLSSAGIIGVMVEPTADKTKHLVISVLAARPGDAAVPP